MMFSKTNLPKKSFFLWLTVAPFFFWHWGQNGCFGVFLGPLGRILTNNYFIFDPFVITGIPGSIIAVCIVEATDGTRGGSRPGHIPQETTAQRPKAGMPSITFFLVVLQKASFFFEDLAESSPDKFSSSPLISLPRSIFLTNCKDVLSIGAREGHIALPSQYCKLAVTWTLAKGADKEIFSPPPALNAAWSIWIPPCRKSSIKLNRHPALNVTSQVGFEFKHPPTPWVQPGSQRHFFHKNEIFVKKPMHRMSCIYALRGLICWSFPWVIGSGKSCRPWGGSAGPATGNFPQCRNIFDPQACQKYPLLAFFCVDFLEHKKNKKQKKHTGIPISIHLGAQKTHWNTHFHLSAQRQKYCVSIYFVEQTLFYETCHRAKMAKTFM